MRAAPNGAPVTLTVTIYVPAPNGAVAKTATFAFIQPGHPVKTLTLGLLPTSSTCSRSTTGLVCSGAVNLAPSDVTYTLRLKSSSGKQTYTRTEVFSAEYGTLSFTIGKQWTTAYVHFQDPTMGKPVRIPLFVDAYYYDTTTRLSEIVIGPQPFASPVPLVDSDSSGATKLSAASVTSPSQQVTLSYDGVSFVNPTISASPSAGVLPPEPLVPFVRTAEFEVPSHTETHTNSGFSRMFVNPDGSITFLENGAIGVVTASGAVHETKLPNYDFDIAPGPAGSTWALLKSGNSRTALVRIKGGSQTKILLPDYDLGPMVYGTDGNFWIAGGSSGPVIRRVSPTGRVNGFPIRGPEASISGAAAGSGNVWFTGAQSPTSGGSPVGAAYFVTQSGAYKAIVIPPTTPPCCPAQLTDPVYAPDGNLYSVVSNQYLARITTKGAFTELPTQLSMAYATGYSPWPLGLGPDGALWYVAGVLNGGQCQMQLGRVTTSGQVAFVQAAPFCNVTSEDGPSAFVAGPGKTLWYTRGTSVGRVSL